MYVKEGSFFQTNAESNGQLTGSASVAGLATSRISSGAVFSAIAKLVVDDGDALAGERVYLVGSQWSGILNRPQALQASGTVSLGNLQ